MFSCVLAVCYLCVSCVLLFIVVLQLRVKPLVLPEFRTTDPVIGGGALGGESVNEPGRRARATGKWWGRGRVVVEVVG